MNDKKEISKFDGFLFTRRIITGLFILVIFVQFFTGCVQSVPQTDASDSANLGWFIGNSIAFFMYGVIYLITIKVINVVEKSMKK